VKKITTSTTLIFTNTITNLFFDTLDDDVISELRSCHVTVARPTAGYEHDADDEETPLPCGPHSPTSPRLLGAAAIFSGMRRLLRVFAAASDSAARRRSARDL